MKTLTGSARASERALILGGAWPHFPILPVQRDADEGDLGLLPWQYVSPEREQEGKDGPWRVYLANLVEIGLRHGSERVTWAKALEDVPFIEYANLDEFFDAGWRGD
jgi:hypothetical protein